MKSAVSWDETARTLCGIQVKPSFRLVENSYDPVFTKQVTCKRCIKIMHECNNVQYKED